MKFDVTADEGLICKSCGHELNVHKMRLKESKCKLEGKCTVCECDDISSEIPWIFPQILYGYKFIWYKPDYNNC